MLYRGLGKAGVEDAQSSGVFRPKQEGTKATFITDNGSEFNLGKKFDKTYYSPNYKIADRYGKGYIVEVPNTSAEFNRRYTNNS